MLEKISASYYNQNSKETVTLYILILEEVIDYDRIGLRPWGL